ISGGKGHTHLYRYRQTHRHTHLYRYRLTHRHTHLYRYRLTHRHTHLYRYRQTHRHTHLYRYRLTHRHTHLYRYREEICTLGFKNRHTRGRFINGKTCVLSPNNVWTERVPGQLHTTRGPTAGLWDAARNPVRSRFPRHVKGFVSEFRSRSGTKSK
uniref:Uncharacterized protein n=1 Tax=Periophthalmus magnuspinnatus TaxID=409849 RepID=A0A3B4B3S8_9GOBI